MLFTRRLLALSLLLPTLLARSAPPAVATEQAGRDPSARDFADPFVLCDGGTYYAFATGYGSDHVQVARSTDLATWTSLPDALPALPGWAAPVGGLTWAPSVLRRDERWVLYYTTRDAASGLQCISRATSARPEGPYLDDSARPFVCQVAACGSIDPSPFTDEAGRAYLLWKSDENHERCRTAPGDRSRSRRRTARRGWPTTGGPRRTRAMPREGPARCAWDASASRAACRRSGSADHPRAPVARHRSRPPPRRRFGLPRVRRG